MITVHNAYAKPDVHDVRLEVQESGATLVVKAGTFRMMKKDYVLDEDLSWTMTSSANRQSITCGLCVDRETDEVVLVVDELEPDDVSFPFTDGPYRLLMRLFHFDIEPNEADLSNTDVRVFHIVENTGEA